MRRIGIVALLVLMAACTQAKVRFESQEIASARLITLEKIDAAGEPLGELPITLPLNQLTGKAIKLESPGRPAHFWLFADQSSELLTIKDNFTGNVAVITKNGELSQLGSDSLQTYSRLLLKAYNALNKRDYDTLTQVTDNMIRQDAKIAAPHILKGAAFIYQGKKEEARAALELAKSLDGSNPDIDLMLKALNQ